MYETYYRLSADPFRLSPDPRFCFEHPSFSRARKYMQYALRRAEGFILVTGRPGTGKTTLVESLLAGLASGGPVAARLVTAQLQPDELLRKVAYAFGLHAERLDKATLLHQLERYLVQQTRTGRGALLVIDEAQGLESSALEELRLLTNLQESNRPVLQIFLVGQERLREIVQAPELEQFHQRLIAACHLRPLDLEETRAYIEHRLRRVGWRGDPQLAGDAILMVHRFSAGVPRRINQVCSRLLLHGAAEERHRLRGQDVLTVIEDLRQEILTPADLPETGELRDLLATAPIEPGPEPLVPEPPAATAAPSEALGEPTEAGAAPAEPLAGSAAADHRPQPTAADPDLPPEVTAHLVPGPEAAPPAAAAPALQEPPPLAPADEPRRAPSGRPLIPPQPPSRRGLRRVFPLLGLVALAGGLLYAFAPQVAEPLRSGLSGLLTRADRHAQPSPAATGPALQALTPGPAPIAPRAVTESAPPATGPPSAGARPAPAPVASAAPAEMASSPAATPAPGTPPGALAPDLPASEPASLAERTADAVRAPAPAGAPAGSVAIPYPLPDLARTAAPAPAGTQPAPALSPAPPPDRSGPLERELLALGLAPRRLDDGTLYVNLRRQVPFERNSFEVGLDARAFLEELASVLRDQEDCLVEVVGHTDDSGTREHNATLARRRAEAVTGYLRQQGVPDGVLRARSPRDPEVVRTEPGEPPADLRRVDLYLSPDVRDTRTALGP
jgi:putative secretion ATPase (PEP-CTERM system associated)